MNITEVKVHLFKPKTRLLGIANITIDGCFVIHEIKIIEGKNGVFVAMPRRKLPNGDFKDIAHPITAEARKQIDEAILEEYNAERFR